jgi:hypothetical protein
MTLRGLSRCAFILVLGLGLPAGVLAQAQGKDPSRDTASVKDLSLTVEKLLRYVGNYES